MKTTFTTLALASIAMVNLTGCVLGSRQMSEMTAQQIKSKIEVGTTTLDGVRDVFGDPQEKGVQLSPSSRTFWYYRYQKLSATFFIPFINIFAKDSNLRGYLRVGFDEHNVAAEVDYRG